MTHTRVLVTGASGHLGANLVHRLVDDWHDVRVLLRPGSDNGAVSGLDVERVYGDLRSQDAVRAAVDGCDRVFHTAAMVSTLQGSAQHKRQVFEANVLGTRNVLRASRDAGVDRVVVTGSFGSNGYDLDDPTRASDESVPFYPFDGHLPYAHAKFQAEHECLRAVVDGLDVVLCSSTAILGPHDYKPSRMGQTLIDFAHGKLHAYLPGGCPFVSADDIVDGHFRAMERGRTGQKYIIATAYLTVDEIMDLFEEVTGVPRPKLRLPSRIMQGVAHASTFVLTRFFPKVSPRFTPDAVRILRMERRADTRKAREELGFEPGDIRQAVSDAYEDFARRGLVPKRPASPRWTPRVGDSADRPAVESRPASSEARVDR